MITSRDGLISALGNNATTFLLDKANVSNAVASTWYSLWRATGIPGQGAIPAAAAVPTNATTGAINFTQPTSPATSYAALLQTQLSNGSMIVELHDRLCHMGGLNGTLTTAQTVGIDLSTLGGTSNLTERMGASNYSDVQWWLEWYTDTGGTGVNATVNVTYNDASTGDLTVQALVATTRASRLYPLNSLIPAAAAGKFIRHVNTVTLSATTAAAGSFGVTASRVLARQGALTANLPNSSNWADLGLQKVANSACVYPIVFCSTTSTGTFRGFGKFIHG
jgi:hypothetical protein